MPDDDVIERYLKQLDAELRLPARARRRIIAEARDHLWELAAGAGDDTGSPQGDDTGSPQLHAINSFGSAGVVARRFAYELALGATRRAARSGASMFVLALVLWDLATSSFVHVAPGWLNDGPGSASLWIIGQVGLVAGAVSLARARMARRAEGADTLRLRYVVRGLIVLSICTVLTVAMAVAGVASAATTQGAGHTSWVLLAALTLGCAAVTAIGAHATWRASQRLAVVDDATMTATGREALLDLVTTTGDGIAYFARHLGLVSSLGEVITTRTWPAQRWLQAFDPQDHPWRFATLIALLAGSAVPALNLVVLTLAGQLDASHLSDLAASTPALMMIEAGFVLSGYAALGRYLGLRPSRTSTSL